MTFHSENVVDFAEYSRARDAQLIADAMAHLEIAIERLDNIDPCRLSPAEREEVRKMRAECATLMLEAGAAKKALDGYLDDDISF